MSDEWLEIADENIDVEEIMAQIRQRLNQNDKKPVIDPVAVAETLWKDIIGDPENLLIANRVPIRPQDCDIAPRNYKIEWRIPVIGYIHAFVRRIIDNEIRMFLFPSLDKQMRYNRRALWVMRALVEENVRLRQDLETLQTEVEKLKQ